MPDASDRWAPSPRWEQSISVRSIRGVPNGQTSVAAAWGRVDSRVRSIVDVGVGVRMETRENSDTNACHLGSSWVLGLFEGMKGQRYLHPAVEKRMYLQA